MIALGCAAVMVASSSEWTANPHSIGANIPVPHLRCTNAREDYSGGQSPMRLALSLVEIVCVKPAIGS